MAFEIKVSKAHMWDLQEMLDEKEIRYVSVLPTQADALVFYKVVTTGAVTLDSLSAIIEFLNSRSADEHTVAISALINDESVESATLPFKNGSTLTKVKQLVDEQ